MPRRPQPGLAFWTVCDLGFAVGLMTHDVPRVGSLIWIAEPTFDEEPTVDEVEAITDWRWPMFFSLGPALHRNIVTRIGTVPVPDALKPFPLMRGGNKKMGWRLVTLVGSPPSLPLAIVADPHVPIYKVVNDTRLKEMIVSGWKPEQEW